MVNYTFRNLPKPLQANELELPQGDLFVRTDFECLMQAVIRLAYDRGWVKTLFEPLAIPLPQSNRILVYIKPNNLDEMSGLLEWIKQDVPREEWHDVLTYLAKRVPNLFNKGDLLDG